MSIAIRTDQNKILCKFFSKDDFDTILGILKRHRCVFDPDTKQWQIPHQRYQEVLDDLQEIDIVDTSGYNPQVLEDLLQGRPELKLSPVRQIFDASLLKLPPKLGKPPFENYQVDDISKALNRNRYAIFWDMGLGKSYAQAAIIAHLRAQKRAHKVLLVSSGIGSMNMVHELNKFLHLKEGEIVSVTKAGKDREVFKPNTSIVVTNYNTFRVICQHYNKLKNPKKVAAKAKAASVAKELGAKVKKSKTNPQVLPLLDWFGDQPGILILDECHNVSNPQSEQTKWFLAHAPVFEYRYLFSGTPFDKNEKLYAQLKILDPALVLRLSYTEWLANYAVLGTAFSPHAIASWRYDKVKELNEKVRAGYGGILRKREDVLVIPANNTKKLYVELSPLHKEVYKAFVVSTLEHLQERNGSLLTRDVVNTFPYLQMAIDNPEELLTKHADLLTPKLTKMIKSFDYNEDHVKVEAVDAILGDHVDLRHEKGILWIWHPASAKLLADKYARYNPLVVIGETASDDRQGILEQFRQSPANKLLIASIKILNTSITLVEAKFQVYVERVYSYSQYIQSTGRISRIGQDQETWTYIPIAESTIDCALDVNLETKDLLNTKLLSKEFLTKNEWKRIFEYTEADAIEDFQVTY